MPNRPVIWYGIGDGFDTRKAVAPFTISPKLAAQIHIGLLRVLLLVQTVLVSLPDIEQSARNGCPLRGKYPSRHDDRLAAAILADGCSHWQFLRAFPVERAKNCALGCPIRHAMIDSVDQHRYAGNIGEQNKLLALLIAHLAGSGQELNRQCPFFLGKFDLTNKSVEMSDEAGHHLLQSEIRRLRHAVQYILGNLLLAIVVHGLTFPS